MDEAPVGRVAGTCRFQCGIFVLGSADDQPSPLPSASIRRGEAPARRNGKGALPKLPELPCSAGQAFAGVGDSRDRGIERGVFLDEAEAQHAGHRLLGIKGGYRDRGDAGLVDQPVGENELPFRTD